jgi:hypothetical protein
MRYVIPASVGLSLFFAFVLGLCAGRLPAHQPATRIVEDHRPGVPVVRIDGVTGNDLIGSIQGEARVFIAGKAVATSSGAFKAPASAVTRIVPGAATGKFVASKRGKKFYPVGSPSGEKLSPSNRVYFDTAEQAMAAGYSR